MYSNSHRSIDPENYINREMSWLEFNQRVLDQAIDPQVPLLERLKFLAITAANLDEFFMVRVGGLQLQKRAGAASSDPSGLTVQEQLRAIRQRTCGMVRSQYEVYLNELEPLLSRHGIERIPIDNCSLRHREAVRRVFEDEIFAVLSPMGLDAEDNFPLLVNRALYVCVQLATAGAENDCRFALIPLGKAIPRLLTLPTEHGFSFALLENAVQCLVQDFFPGEQILSSATFRITRNADISLQEDAAADLLHGMKEILQQRKTAECVRLEIDEQAPDSLLRYLQSRLRIGDDETFKTPSPVDLSFLAGLTGIEGYDHLRYKPWPPQHSPAIDPSQSMFATIAERDVLLCHPYDSYEPVVRLIDEAADDPDVLAIKQTLYRTSRNSAIVGALRRAAERGKYVTTIVELKARFDEARNIEWAEELEEAGVQVIYGVKHLKTHAKVCIIVRREPKGIVRYLHFGTGNYNESTAQLYSDISYFTSNLELGKDSSSFFNAITGYSQPQQYTAIEAAPIGLRKKLLSLIDSEIERRKQGQRASIMAKLNALVDSQLIAALYRASQAGVTVQLNVRGICCLRPGVPGLSENITVISIVDRLLEHARVVYFRHGGDDLAFISSADWMPRNLDKRVELLVPVEDRACKKRLIEILEAYFRDTQNCWQLQADGQYLRRRAEDEPFRAQEFLYQSAVDALKLDEQKRTTVFEPHQPVAKQGSD
jgi:polyphosphate kinase